MAIDNEVKNVLDEHKQILDEHTEKIGELMVDNATTKERLNSISTQMNDVKGTLVRFENNYLQTTNAMMGTLSQVVINTSNNATQIKTTKMNNRTDIIIKVLIGLGVFLAGIASYKYGIKFF